MSTIRDNNNHITEQYKDFILKYKHPCIMAKTVFSMENYVINTYDSFYKTDVILQLLNDLESYIENYDFESNEFQSFLAVFPNSEFDSEIEFETHLWEFLQKLHEYDDCEWDSNVSNNPESPNFSFSIKGKAFYVVGLHPKSSRMARQSPYPTLVFNLHWQFEKLREMGTYKKVKKRIRKRDKKLQGNINPVLKDFGKATETRQYSGRHVEENWKCPFIHKSENL